MAVPEDDETSERVAKEVARLQKRAQKSASALEALRARRQQPQYVERVPESVRAQDDARVVQLETDVDAAEKSLAVLLQLQHQYQSMRG